MNGFSRLLLPPLQHGRVIQYGISRGLKRLGGLSPAAGFLAVVGVERIPGFAAPLADIDSVDLVAGFRQRGAQSLQFGGEFSEVRGIAGHQVGGIPRLAELTHSAHPPTNTGSRSSSVFR